MHEEPDIVTAAFDSLYGKVQGMERAERMNKRNEVAKQLVTTSHKHLVADLEIRAKENHQRDLKEWGLGLAEVGEAEDVHLYVFLYYPSVAYH